MPSAKCISGCKGFPMNTCNKAPRCTYINGEKYQYCRLAHRFKMGKYPGCQISRRIKKADKLNKSAKVIQQMFKKVKGQTQGAKTKDATKGAKVIANFMKRTTQKRRAEFLKAICADSGVCMAFGTNRKKILDFFGGFNNMDYAISPIKQIGKPSANGFVKEIKYEKRGYTSFAVLKSAANAGSDNLAYEYIVGQFINEKAKRFPCFIETYGLYYYKDEKAWEHSIETSNMESNRLRNSLVIQKDPFDYKKMCQESKYSAILIEHLKGVKSFGDFLFHSPTDNVLASFIVYHVPSILYQIYFPLSILRKVFTHYDLHQDNVLLYEPIKGKHIKYHYHLNGTVITFNSPYIVKIIDYGRSFYRSDTLIKPKQLYNELCDEPDCDNCGWDSGLSWLEPVHEESNFFISSSIVNESHDLKLMDIVNGVMGVNVRINVLPPSEKIMFASIKDVVNKVLYGQGLSDPNESDRGTKKNRISGLPGAIHNVADAEHELRGLLENPLLKQVNNALYNDVNKIGDMHIYKDGRPILFVSV